MGVFEVLIVLAIALVVFGGYFRKRLPQIGRSAGENTRIGIEKARIGAGKAREATDAATAKANEKVGDRFDAGAMGRSAGKGLREAREFRDSLKGPVFDPNERPQPRREPRPAQEEPEVEAAPDPGPDDQPRGSAT